jgi:hypothetical protein
VRKDAEKIKIKYTVECYLEGLERDIGHKKEFIVREFYFTDQEIMEDWNKY